MRVLITGAAGMLGRKLTARLTSAGVLAGGPIDQLDLADIAAIADEVGHRTIEVDLAEPGAAERIAASGYDVVFHLAGVVSGEAEADLTKGYRVNLDGTRRLFDALAAADAIPRVVFTSSIAVFGAPFPDIIPDDFHLTPLTSYGTQKAMGEGLLADYSRRGLIDGIGIRLPTITVRPGSPNAAASGFFSGIVREPLAGTAATLPVPRSVRHPHASPRTAVDYLIHAAELDTAAVGPRRNLTMPSLSVTVQEQIDALERVAGPAAVDLIEERPDPAVATIVSGWPERFATDRADALGFRCERTYDEIIACYLEDDRPRS
ncbi:MAG: SDR family oxidoreductase [Acidimicrobiia bacterium]|nr:SDR family oxidoreductase [Acidimicrobiia bacterium]